MERRIHDFREVFRRFRHGGEAVEQLNADPVGRLENITRIHDLIVGAAGIQLCGDRAVDAGVLRLAGCAFAAGRQKNRAAEQGGNRSILYLHEFTSCFKLYLAPVEKNINCFRFLRKSQMRFFR